MHATHPFILLGHMHVSTCKLANITHIRSSIYKPDPLSMLRPWTCVPLLRYVRTIYSSQYLHAKHLMQHMTCELCKHSCAELTKQGDYLHQASRRRRRPRRVRNKDPSRRCMSGPWGAASARCGGSAPARAPRLPSTGHP